MSIGEILVTLKTEFPDVTISKIRFLEEEATPRREPTGEPGPDDLATPPTGLHMSIEELATATGVDRNRIKELETFGILCAHGLNGDQYYDGDDFVVLSIAKDFFKY